MNPLLLVAASVVVGGAVIATSARDARAALIGLTVTLLLAPLLADPLPGIVDLGIRVASTLLAAYLLRVTLRETTFMTSGSGLGWPAEALAAAAAFLVGVSGAALGGPALGPPAALAAGFAVGILSLSPIALGRDVFRIGIGLVLMLNAVFLVRSAVAGTPAPLEQLILGVLTVGLVGSVAVLCANAFAAGGAFDLRERGRRQP